MCVCVCVDGWMVCSIFLGEHVLFSQTPNQHRVFLHGRWGWVGVGGGRRVLMLGFFF